MAQFELSWHAPEYEHRQKGVNWYWTSIIIACVIVAFAVWERNFLFGFFVVVAEMLFVAWGDRPPRMILFRLSDRELAIDGDKKIYPINQLESWSAETLDEDWIELNFSFKAKLKTPIRILLSTEHIENLRTSLKTILRETEYQPTLLDTIERLIRF